MLPNGLELSCPAEAGGYASTVRLVGGRDKPPRKRRPPGQLQRVVGQPNYHMAVTVEFGRHAEPARKPGTYLSVSSITRRISAGSLLYLLDETRRRFSSK